MSSENYLIKDQNATYFLTFTIVEWVDVFTRKEYKIVVAYSLNYCVENKGLEIFAWCLMSNHLHLVCRAKAGYILSDIVRDFKKFTAKAILEKIEMNLKAAAIGCCIGLSLRESSTAGFRNTGFGRTRAMPSNWKVAK